LDWRQLKAKFSHQSKTGWWDFNVRNTIMEDLKYYINDHYVTEKYFWHAIQSLISQSKIGRLLAGEKMIIGGVSYQIVEAKN
jgi:hypothetical protein